MAMTLGIVNLQASSNGTAGIAQQVDPSLMEYDATVSSVTVAGLNRTLTCGENLVLSWSGAS